jgi:hypothetical protein
MTDTSHSKGGQTKAWEEDNRRKAQALLQFVRQQRGLTGLSHKQLAKDPGLIAAFSPDMKLPDSKEQAFRLVILFRWVLLSEGRRACLAFLDDSAGDHDVGQEEKCADGPGMEAAFVAVAPQCCWSPSTVHKANVALLWRRVCRACESVQPPVPTVRVATVRLLFGVIMNHLRPFSFTQEGSSLIGALLLIDFIPAWTTLGVDQFPSLVCSECAGELVNEEQLEHVVLRHADPNIVSGASSPISIAQSHLQQ